MISRTDARNGPYANAQYHEIEVIADAQHPALHFAAIPIRLEIASFAGHLLAADQLIEVRARRPARQPIHVNERFVLASAFDPRLNGKLETLDVRAFVAGRGLRNTYIVEPMEELERNAPALQNLVERREHGVPHADPHLPKHRTPVSEQHPQ